MADGLSKFWRPAKRRASATLGDLRRICESLRPWVEGSPRTMKTIAALLLTIAIALFPLSGDRALASLASHGPALVHSHADSDGPVPFRPITHRPHLHGRSCRSRDHAHMPAPGERRGGWPTPRSLLRAWRPRRMLQLGLPRHGRARFGRSACTFADDEPRPAACNAVAARQPLRRLAAAAETGLKRGPSPAFRGSSGPLASLDILDPAACGRAGLKVSACRIFHAQTVVSCACGARPCGLRAHSASLSRRSRRSHPRRPSRDRRCR